MEGLLQRVIEEHEITDIYYLGFSKGAIFVDFFPRYCDLKWWPRAVVIYAGGHVGDRPAVEKYPVMLIRGTDDHMVPRGYDPQRALTEAQRWYLDHGHPVSVLEPEGERHEWDAGVNPKVYRFLRLGKITLPKIEDMPPIDITGSVESSEYIRRLREDD
jgi:predicted esterase